MWLSYINTHIMISYLCIFPPECYAAGWEGGPEEPAQTTGDAELQPAGTDCGSAETDGLFTGEQHNTADTERQAAGNPQHISFTSTTSDRNNSVIK